MVIYTGAVWISIATFSPFTFTPGSQQCLCIHVRSNTLPYFIADITVGYKEIATVPIGATHIRAKDYNENFLGECSDIFC